MSNTKLAHNTFVTSQGRIKQEGGFSTIEANKVIIESDKSQTRIFHNPECSSQDTFNLVEQDSFGDNRVFEAGTTIDSVHLRVLGDYELPANANVKLGFLMNDSEYARNNPDPLKFAVYNAQRISGGIPANLLNKIKQITFDTRLNGEDLENLFKLNCETIEVPLKDKRTYYAEPYRFSLCITVSDQTVKLSANVLEITVNYRV